MTLHNRLVHAVDDCLIKKINYLALCCRIFENIFSKSWLLKLFWKFNLSKISCYTIAMYVCIILANVLYVLLPLCSCYSAICAHHDNYVLKTVKLWAIINVLVTLDTCSYGMIYKHGVLLLGIKSIQFYMLYGVLPVPDGWWQVMM